MNRRLIKCAILCRMWLKCLSVSVIARALGVLCVGSASLAAAAPAVDWTHVAPGVIRYDTTDPVTLTARVSGGIPTSVLFAAADGSTLTMRDDGGGADAVAGDGIYTTQLTAAQAVSGLLATDVNRKFVGFVDLYQSAVRILRVAALTQVWSPPLGTVDLVSVSPTVRYSNFVVNIVDTATFAAGPYGDFRPLVKKFYQTFGDDFDFIDIVFDTTYIANRYHFGVSNAVSGVGIPPFNNTSDYGSAGRLLGITIFPIRTSFDGGQEAHSHEIGHQWINFLSQPTLAPGTAHWPLSSLANGLMGFSLLGSGAGGDYSCRLTPVAGGIELTPFSGPRPFTDLDLYLMGLRPAAQVGSHYVWNDQVAAQSQTCSGTIPYSQFTQVTINNVIASDGERLPAFANAQKDFKVAVIVVSNALLSTEAMAFYTFFAQRAEARVLLDVHQGLYVGGGNPFYVATGGTGTLTARLRNGSVLDIDGNGKFDALTDGLMTLRHLFGLSGASLTSGATVSGATRTGATAVLSYLDGINPQLDIDGDGKSDALTDGVLLIRYLFGLRGASLVSGAVSANATRTTSQIEAYVNSLTLP